MKNLVEVLNSIPNGPRSVAGPLTRLAQQSALKCCYAPPCGGLYFLMAKQPGNRHRGPSASPVWFAFSGNGSQWAGMARELFDENPLFRDRICACASVLQKKYKFDFLPHFNAEKGWDDPVSASAGLTAIQIALVDVLSYDFGIKPAGIFGHSAGEISAGYADGGPEFGADHLCCFMKEHHGHSSAAMVLD
eukprot:jgi/Botrbrau1/15493/Bobra.43_2s0110.1